MVQPRTRLQILNRSAVGKTYGEIAQEVGVSKYKVSQVINEYESLADEYDADDVMARVFISGTADMIAYADFSL